MTLWRAVVIFLVAAAAGLAAGPAKAAAEQRLHPALVCAPTTEFAHSWFGAAFLSSAVGTLRCPYVADSVLPLSSVVVIRLRVSDQTTTDRITATACVSGTYGYSTACGTPSSTSIPGTGDEFMFVSPSAWVSGGGAAYVQVSMPVNARITSFLVMD